MHHRVITRARFLRLLAACGVGVGAAPLFPALGADEADGVSDAATFVRNSLVVDGQFVPRNQSDGTWPTSPGEVKRMIGVDAGVWDVEDVENLIQVDKLVGHYGNTVVRVDKADDIGLARATGRLGLIYYASRHWKLDDSVEPLARWHEGGLRAIQITHEGGNGIGGGFDRDELPLTAFGKQVVMELNRLGLLVDVSHCGRRTTLDVAAASSQPIVACRANASALTPHDKNKSDKEIKRDRRDRRRHRDHAPRNRFLRRGDESGGRASRTSSRQVDHVVQLVGIDHVGLASDTLDETENRATLYDRADSNLNVNRRWFNVARGLAGARDTPTTTWGKLLGRNFLNVLAKTIG